MERRKIYFNGLECSPPNKQTQPQEGGRGSDSGSRERFSKVRKPDHFVFVGDFVMRIGALRFQGKSFSRD